MYMYAYAYIMIIIRELNVSVFSLGSTRFFKVARARTKEGLAVVKVFVIHDPSLPLASHRNKLEGKFSNNSRKQILLN